MSIKSAIESIKSYIENIENELNNFEDEIPLESSVDIHDVNVDMHFNNDVLTIDVYNDQTGEDIKIVKFSKLVEKLCRYQYAADDFTINLIASQFENAAKMIRDKTKGSGK